MIRHILLDVFLVLGSFLVAVVSTAAMSPERLTIDEQQSAAVFALIFWITLTSGSLYFWGALP